MDGGEDGEGVGGVALDTGYWQMGAASVNSSIGEGTGGTYTTILGYGNCH